MLQKQVCVCFVGVAYPPGSNIPDNNSLIYLDSLFTPLFLFLSLEFLSFDSSHMIKSFRVKNENKMILDINILCLFLSKWNK